MGDLTVKFVELTKEFVTDYSKFDCTGNKAAGTRARGKAQELRALLTEIRTAIQTKKKEAKCEAP